MPQRINGKKCQHKTNGDDSWAIEVISKVTGTIEDCCISPEGDPMHEVEVKNMRERAISGQIEIESDNLCIEYEEPNSETYGCNRSVNLNRKMENSPNPSQDYEISIYVCDDPGDYVDDRLISFVSASVATTEEPLDSIKLSPAIDLEI